MPTVSVFIRKDDLPKWKALEHKSEWLHEHLDMSKTTKDGYRSEHFYSIPINDPTSEPFEPAA